MSVVYRMQVQISDPDHEAHESFWSQAGTDGAFMLQVKKYCELRSQLLGLGAAVDWARLSAYETDPKLTLLRTLPTLYGNPFGGGWNGDLAVLRERSVLLPPPADALTADEETDWASDVPGSSAKIRLGIGGDELTPGRGIHVRLAFPPDIVLSVSRSARRLTTLQYAAFIQWRDIVFAPWATHLQSGFLTLSRRRDSPLLQIVGVLPADPPDEIFAGASIAGIGHAFVVGDRVLIRNRRNRRGFGRQRELNRAWQIASIDEVEVPETPAKNHTDLRFICSTNLVVDPCRQLGTLSPVEKELRPITTVNFVKADKRRVRIKR